MLPPREQFTSRRTLSLRQERKEFWERYLEPVRWYVGTTLSAATGSTTPYAVQTRRPLNEEKFQQELKCGLMLRWAQCFDWHQWYWKQPLFIPPNAVNMKTTPWETNCLRLKNEERCRHEKWILKKTTCNNPISNRQLNKFVFSSHREKYWPKRWSPRLSAFWDNGKNNAVIVWNNVFLYQLQRIFYFSIVFDNQKNIFWMFYSATIPRKRDWVT